MVNQLWASSRIVSQNNRRTRAEDEPNNNNERIPQGILQRPQNHHVSLNNFGLGRYQENNVADARTQPMVPFSFSGNNMTLPREISQNNGLTLLNQWEGEYQIPILHQSSLDIHLRTPQGLLERPQNRHVISLNNFTQGRYHENNVVSSRTPPMAPFSFITSARYDQMLSPGLLSDPQPLIGPHRITPYRANSIQNSSTNGVGANNFANPSRPFFHNRRSFRYLPYGESSNFSARLSVDLHSLNNAIPITTPPSNANRDLARDIGDTDDDCNEAGKAKEIKLLDLFKDENNATPTSSVNENDEQNLDLSLHL